MGSKNILTIKNYHSGGGDLIVEVVSSMIEKNNRLTVSRVPDQYSARLATLAHFNKSKRALIYGFTEMTLIIYVSQISDSEKNGQITGGTPFIRLHLSNRVNRRFKKTKGKNNLFERTAEMFLRSFFIGEKKG